MLPSYSDVFLVSKEVMGSSRLSQRTTQNSAVCSSVQKMIYKQKCKMSGIIKPSIIQKQS